ncbi:hypothetical protein [Tepidiforma thermophila]|uniref:Uncharacterized protein n=1 Tax=Tepidiforma thermophila (strain KCTC 52669 / CGMCC 1.13589 / G233) TaxID=2761530 RepID=A0A2A9HBW8_TEPT2|nr:hypothetical protein [Tepidiforma thermophila]PFG73248.1 hypothetical protein A9A59_0443 [Tepidiforma thermophila]
MSIEQHFEQIDKETAALSALAAKVNRATRAAARAAAEGNLAAAARNLQTCGALLAEAAGQAQAAQAALERARARLAEGPGDLIREVGERVSASGAPWLPTENPYAFVSFPVLVRFLGDGVRIDRKLVRSQRPGAIAASIERARTAKDGNAERILRLVWRAARAAAGHVSTPVAKLPPTIRVPAKDVFEVLGLNNPDYTEVDFTRHLYLLDRTRVSDIDGYRLTFSASTGTRSGRHFRILDEYGAEHAYYLVEFERVTSS